MPPSDPTLRAWWPTTQSLDLVEAPIAEAAAAIQTEFTRFADGVPVKAEWRAFTNLAAAFEAAPHLLSGAVSFFLVLPTRSRWSVMWNNNTLCDGYDSLCWCLTTNHRLTTLHWSAHDEWTSFQSGSMFHHRRHDGAGIFERRVQTAQTDKKWDFSAEGPALPEEDLAAYDAKRKRDRLDEARTLALLKRLGAEPWSEDFYALPEQKAFVISRPAPPGLRSFTLADFRRELEKRHAWTSGQ